MIFLFSFFENPHEFNGYQICIWDGFDFWMATSNLNENAKEFRDKINQSNNDVEKWNIYVEYFKPYKMDIKGVKKVLDIYAIDKSFFHENVIKMMNDYIVKYNRNDKIEKMLKMIDINFEGKIVKMDKSGYYKCPFKCKSGNFLRKWKTESGFQKHMVECRNKPSEINKLIEKQNKDKLEFEKIKEEILSELNFKIGDRINYVKETIINPMYEERWGRRVKVRYEDVKKYEAMSDEIRSININFYNSLDKGQIKSTLLINNRIPIKMIYPSLEEAKLEAKKMQDGHDEHLRFSSFVR